MVDPKDDHEVQVRRARQVAQRHREAELGWHIPSEPLPPGLFPGAVLAGALGPRLLVGARADALDEAVEHRLRHAEVASEALWVREVGGLEGGPVRAAGPRQATPAHDTLGRERAVHVVSPKDGAEVGSPPLEGPHTT